MNHTPHLYTLFILSEHYIGLWYTRVQRQIHSGNPQFKVQEYESMKRKKIVKRKSFNFRYWSDNRQKFTFISPSLTVKFTHNSIHSINIGLTEALRPFLILSSSTQGFTCFRF